jgi:hypothetical protein
MRDDFVIEGDLMSTVRTKAALLGWLLIVPAASFAFVPQTASSTKAPASKATTAAPKPAVEKAAIHATRGVVKSVDATSLVISRAATKKAKAKEMSFVLNSATQEKGKPAVGSTVEVRYKTEAKQNIATAVNVQEKK